MVTIAFSHPSDGIAMLKKCIKQAAKLNINPSFAKLSETTAKVLELHIQDEKEIILDVLTEFTRYKVEDICIKEMIEHAFMFQDSTEQKEIFSITKSIIHGEIEGIPEVKSLPELNQMIRCQWQSLFEASPDYFEFEAFLKFRLKDYLSTLLKLVECAIDEYKMELEYQTFVDQLRSSIFKQKSRSENKCIVIFDCDHTVIFDGEHNPISQKSIEKLHEKAVKLTNVPNLDTRLLGPLIGLAPVYAHIYAYDIDHPLLHTVKNIFQEGVTICPIEKMTPKNKKKS